MNLANALTISRIVSVPVIVILLFFDSPIPSTIAAVLFIAATSTDYLDGYVARKYQMESDLGKLLDPLADKLLIASVLILSIVITAPIGAAGIDITYKKFLKKN